MTDIAVGKALGSGRQAAIRARNHGALITRRLEASARFQDEAVVRHCIRNRERDLGECGRFPRL